MEKQKTLDEFIAYLQKDFSRFSEIEVRKAIDRLAFWVKATTDDEEFIVHLYLGWLSNKFNFDIDTNIDSRH